VREHNNGNMPMDVLVQYAQRNGDVRRRSREEQRAEETRRAEARRKRRAARNTQRSYVRAAMTGPSRVREVGPGLSPRDPGLFVRPETYNCLAYSMRGNFFRKYPRLDAATKALLLKAYKELMTERYHWDKLRPREAVAAVGTSLGPPSSSQDEKPPPGVKAE